MLMKIERSRYDLAAGIEGKTVLVTGASSGIGKACAEALLACGAKVAGTYNRRPDGLRDLEENAPGLFSSHAIDMGDGNSIRRVVDEVSRRWGDLDGLVHSAGVGSATVVHYEADPYRQTDAFFRINATGTKTLLDATLAAMDRNQDYKARRDIVVISSVGSKLQIFPDFQSADAASKAAAADLALHEAGKRIHDARYRINVVCPGATNTSMLFESVLYHFEGDPTARAAFEAQLPHGRLIQPDEIADFIVYLISDRAAAINAAVLDATSGLALRPGLVTEMKH